MKGFSILIFLFFIGSGICFAQEAVEDTTSTDATAAQQEEQPMSPPEETVPEEETIPDGGVSQEAAPEEDGGFSSQEDGSSPGGEEGDSYIEDEEFVYKMNQKGDQFIKIGVMVDIPLRPNVNQLHVGGSGTLGYMRFLNSNFAVGGDASFAYMTTLGDNIFTCIPLMAKVMYQFTLGKFEFPITLGIGGAFENYIGDMYFGLIIKPELGAFYRHSPDWSFGANVGWNLMPQWTKDSSYFGVIMDAGITVRYHF